MWASRGDAGCNEMSGGAVMSGSQRERSGRVAAVVVDAGGVGSLLGRSERSVWRDDKAGRIPAPVTIGGSKRWRLDELLAWIDAGCPARATWESLARRSDGRPESAG
jgi:predicted DNA-binding transcriptional regulator AlpA